MWRVALRGLPLASVTLTDSLSVTCLAEASFCRAAFENFSATVVRTLGASFCDRFATVRFRCSRFAVFLAIESEAVSLHASVQLKRSFRPFFSARRSRCPCGSARWRTGA